MVGGLGLYCTRDWLVCILRVPSAGCVRCGASHSPGCQIVRRLVHLFKYDAHHCRQRSRRRTRSALGSSSRGPPALALRTSFSPQIGAGVDQTEDGTDGLRFPRVRPPMPTCMGRAMATVSNANATAGRERPRRARAAVARDDSLRFPSHRRRRRLRARAQPAPFSLENPAGVRRHAPMPWAMARARRMHLRARASPSPRSRHGSPARPPRLGKCGVSPGARCSSCTPVGALLRAGHGTREELGRESGEGYDANEWARAASFVRAFSFSCSAELVCARPPGFDLSPGRRARVRARARGYVALDRTPARARPRLSLVRRRRYA